MRAESVREGCVLIVLSEGAVGGVGSGTCCFPIVSLSLCVSGLGLMI